MDDRSLSSEVIGLVLSQTAFTDIHIEEDAPVVIKTPRDQWEVVPSILPASKEDLRPLLKMIDGEWESKIRSRAIDRPVNLSTYRLRCNAYTIEGGKRLVVTFRRQPRDPKPLNEIGLPAAVKSWVSLTRGLILVVGATRSGKTTTIASFADAINTTRSAHIVTVEDPIEYVLQRKKAIISQKEVSRGGSSDVDTYADGLRDAMRQNPDVLVIGEIRDSEAAQVALNAAESGSLVMATMHANSVAGAIQKFIKFFPAETQSGIGQILASSLIGVVAQSLLPSLDGKEFVIASELLNNASANNGGTMDKIRSGDSSQIQKMIEESGNESVGYSLNSNLAKLIKANKIDKAAARRVTYSRALLEAEFVKEGIK